MSKDAKTLLADLGKDRALVPKSKLPDAAKAALQRKLDDAIAAARALVVAREAMLKELASQQEKKTQLEAAARTLATAVKSHSGALATKLAPIAAARGAAESAAADPVLTRLRATLTELETCLRDLSPFQDLDWR